MDTQPRPRRGGCNSRQRTCRLLPSARQRLAMRRCRTTFAGSAATSCKRTGAASGRFAFIRRAVLRRFATMPREPTSPLTRLSR